MEQTIIETKEKKDALVICRCSTDESKQDVTLQINPCVEHCNRQGWSFDVLSYYGSASKGIPPELQQALNKIRKKYYRIVVTYSMDRFSRQTPSLTEKMLNYITDCGGRFISIQENLIIL
jgi:DNA invertase Pin-like site-specific DNA recombinase